MSYVKVEKEILYSDKFTCDEKVVLMAMMDRLSLSQTQGDKFKMNGQYFIRYSQDEMAKVIGKSPRTVFSIYRHLESMNVITRQKHFNASDTIFLPILAKFATMDSQKLPTSNHYLNKHNNTCDTVKTGLKNKIEHWKQAVVSKTKLPELAVDTILKFTNNNLTKAYAIVGTINKAKKHVARQYRLLNSPVSRFESNTNIQQQITSKLAYLFNYAGKADNLLAYLKKGLQTFFIDAFGLVKDELVEPVAKSKQKPKIDRKKPAWMNEKYDASKDAISDEEKLEVAKLLEKFEKDKDDLSSNVNTQPVRSESKQRKTCTLAEHLANNAILGV